MTCSSWPEKGLYIETTEDLRSLCCHLRQGDRLALDTEFVSEQTYVPQLGLIQVAGNGLLALVDPLAVPSLDPLVEFLRDPALEKSSMPDGKNWKSSAPTAMGCPSRSSMFRSQPLFWATANRPPMLTWCRN